MLVVIPFSATVLALVFSIFVPLVTSQAGGGFNYAFSYIYLISISSLVYAFYPMRFRNIEKRGFSNLLVEQTCIKKILYVEIPVLIFATSVFLVLGYAMGSPIDAVLVNFFDSMGKPFEEYKMKTQAVTEKSPIEFSAGFFGAYFFSGLMFNLGFSITAGIVWMVLVAARKELGYYFAKYFVSNSLREKEESKKAQYLIKATKIYDKYLRRTLNLEINNPRKFIRKFLSDS